MERALHHPAGRIPAEQGYDFVRDIASGGYGTVSLFRRREASPTVDDYVAVKFVYRHVFGPPEDASGAASYQRASEGLQNFRSLSRASPYLLRIFEVRQRHEEVLLAHGPRINQNAIVLLSAQANAGAGE
jgi:hypothetical protein